MGTSEQVVSVSSGHSALPSPSALLTKALGSHLAVSDSRFSRLAPIEEELMNTKLDSYPTGSPPVGVGRAQRNPKETGEYGKVCTGEGQHTHSRSRQLVPP